METSFEPKGEFSQMTPERLHSLQENVVWERQSGVPQIIQGGMGVAISHWPLARAVSMAGQLGVVSGTAIDTVLVRRLQDGDVGGHVRRALGACPWPTLAKEVLSRYYRPQGREPGEPYLLTSLWKLTDDDWNAALAMMGAFIEVWLAKSGHAGQVGMNLLTKVALPNLAMLYGAMRANVDVIIMGAGIPRDIPAALDLLACHRRASQTLEVNGLPSTQPHTIEFDPLLFESTSRAPLKRPAFFPIVSSYTLALFMAKKATGSIQGFIIEGPTAGGHNAPPRGSKQLDALQQPVYGDRDVVDLDAISKLGYPYWIAGGYGFPGALDAARAQGASGIQVGTLFAYCSESGMDAQLKAQVVTAVRADSVTLRTDALASPTGYPFKVVDIAGSVSDPEVYAARQRHCDLGYLREAYADGAGSVRFRCSAEPVATYVAKGGRIEDTVGRKCLCNALLATAGMPQTTTVGVTEPTIVTSGDSISQLVGLFASGNDEYSAQDVIAYLMNPAR